MKRVLCLYRVSTLKQVDKQDDIPMQRRECMDFIERMDDWKFIGECMEKGVSGYKVSANNRDVIIEIRELAKRKEFDVLLVFMFDRLGRKEDETPFLVKWFIDHGIEVWSTREGQQKLDNQVDRLMNYMRFWAASGESEKTSIRVKAAHSQMTQDGLWRGGKCPFGYKLVRKGRMGKKNRPLYDLEIDEEQAPIVREIFELLIVNGMGTLRIANYLNEKYPDPKKVWSPRTIRSMICNPIYTGRMHMNDIQSEPIESLRIISDDELEFGTYAIAKRIPKKYFEEKEAKKRGLAPKTTKSSVYGASLLSGILYCGHCGKKLVGGYCVKHLASHDYHRPVYRCYNGAVNAHECDGPRTYSGTKLDEAVMSVVYSYFSTVREESVKIWREKAQLKYRRSVQDKVNMAKAKLDRLQKNLEGLKRELLNALTGNSLFDQDMLSEMINENKAEREKAEAAYRESQDPLTKEEERINYLSRFVKDILDWSEQFDKLGTDQKKMILARLIDRIDVYRDYHMTIRFHVSLEDFFGEKSPEEDDKDQAS